MDEGLQIDKNPQKFDISERFDNDQNLGESEGLVREKLNLDSNLTQEDCGKQ
jgi:hypothetical protein